MAKFSIEIDLPGLKEDQVVNLSQLQEDKKRMLLRFLCATGGALHAAPADPSGPGMYCQMVDRFLYSVFSATATE